MKASKTFFRFVAILLCIAQLNLGLAYAARSNKKDTPTPAVLQRIQSAKTIYLVDGGADAAFTHDMAGNAESSYNQLHTSLNTWGHYRLSPSLTGADLVFNIHSYEVESCTDSTDANNITTTSCSNIPYYLLTIKDPDTLDALWTITAPAGYAFTQKNGAPGVSRSITDLTTRIKLLSGETLSATEKKSLANHNYLAPVLLVGGLGLAAATVFAIRAVSANKHCHPGVPCDVFN